MVRGRRPMLARCWFRVAIVAAVIISIDCCVSGGGVPLLKWGTHRAWALPALVCALASGGARQFCVGRGPWIFEGGTMARCRRRNRGRNKNAKKVALKAGYRDWSLAKCPIRCHCPPLAPSSLGLISPVQSGVFAMVRSSHVCGTVAGSGVHLSAALPFPSLAGPRDGFFKPVSGMSSAVNLVNAAA